MLGNTALKNENNPYQVNATAELPTTRILKNEETFGIFDIRGDLYPIGNDELGIYHEGTRFLSLSTFKIGATQAPLMLNSYIRKENGALGVELTNPDLDGSEDCPQIKKSALYISRKKILIQSGCNEEIRFFNYSDDVITLPIHFEFDADFKDVFEIRGMHRLQRGTRLKTEYGVDRVTLGYQGLDNIARFTSIHFSLKPKFDLQNGASLSIKIQPHQASSLEIRSCFSSRSQQSKKIRFSKAAEHLEEIHQSDKSQFCQIHSSSDEYNQWIDRSQDDLVMMNTLTSSGYRYPFAGIPWYCTAFGRDGIWTSLLCLWANPQMAKEALQFLAATQATELDELADAQPGKIIHEVRSGEMANLKEIPFGKYYGSVDSTPLFLILAGEYYQRTADFDTIEKIWPQLIKANEWIEKYGDPDEDGFTEYASNSKRGLTNQGWKDSHDAIFHANGTDPKGPIALCEVQGYVYSARNHFASLAEKKGMQAFAADLRKKAAKLKDQFDLAFWNENLQTFVIALDGDKKQCAIRSSNAGHLFYTGILKPERIAPLAKSILQEEMFSGWGIRTISTREKRYNPISYHNGSVWPHDNAIIAMGMAKYGLKSEVEKIFLALYRASNEMEHTRMPEVFCGFPSTRDPPTLYPVACSPQAWSSATVYGLTGALLGVEIDAVQNRMVFRNPSLPENIPRLRLHDLRVADTVMKVSILRHREDVSVRLISKKGTVRFVIEK